jgi:hypothetical protein
MPPASALEWSSADAMIAPRAGACQRRSNFDPLRRADRGHYSSDGDSAHQSLD